MPHQYTHRAIWTLRSERDPLAGSPSLPTCQNSRTLDLALDLALEQLCQKEHGERTNVEAALFKYALENLDVLYSHQRIATLLTTRLPAGVHVERTYDDRGWCSFERAVSQLIKPLLLSMDIGLFTIDKACEAYQIGDDTITPLRIGEVRFAERSVEELAQQGSFCNKFQDSLGMLERVTFHGVRARAPLSPEAFATALQTKTFTNGADSATVIELYRKTATALLGFVPNLEFFDLEWTTHDFAQLADALRFCSALETLGLGNFPLFGEAELALVVEALPPLKNLYLARYRGKALPDISRLAPSLETLSLFRCSELTTLPDLSSFVSLRTLRLTGCDSLAALPSRLKDGVEVTPPEHL